MYDYFIGETRANTLLNDLTGQLMLNSPIAKEKLKVSKIVFNKSKKTTVIIWDDGTKTKVRASEGDEYNEMFGFLMAYYQKQQVIVNLKLTNCLIYLM